jgi:WD40 repeat protein
MCRALHLRRTCSIRGLFLFVVTFGSVLGCDHSAKLAQNSTGESDQATAIPAGLADQRLHGDMAFSPDGQTLAVANYDGVVKVCNVTTGNVVDLPSPYPDKKGADWSNNVAYSKHGQCLAVAYDQRAVVVRDIPGLKEKVRIDLEKASVHSMAFTDGDHTLLGLLLTFATDAPPEPGGGRRLKYLAVRWDISSGKRLSALDLGSYCRFEVLSSDGRFAVVNLRSKPGTTPFVDSYDVVDLATGAKLFQVGGFGVDPDWGVLAGSWAFSADGSTLVTCNQRGLLIREVPSGKKLRHFDKDSFVTTNASLSADGKLLAVNSGCVLLFNAETGRQLGAVSCGGDDAGCDSVLISRDGHALATQRETVGWRDQSVMPLLKVWRIPASWRAGAEVK